MPQHKPGVLRWGKPALHDGGVSLLREVAEALGLVVEHSERSGCIIRCAAPNLARVRADGTVRLSRDDSHATGGATDLEGVAADLDGVAAGTGLVGGAADSIPLAEERCACACGVDCAISNSCLGRLPATR